MQGDATLKSVAAMRVRVDRMVVGGGSNKKRPRRNNCDAANNQGERD